MGETAISRTTDASLILLLLLLGEAEEQQQHIEELEQARAAEEQCLPVDSDEPAR